MATTTPGGRRQSTLELVATAASAERRPGHVVRVAVDGVDGAGKTVFADEVAAVLERQGVRVLRASVDGFHHPPQLRYRRGRDSPDGFYLDSFDLEALRTLLLDPLADGGDRRVVRRIHDVHAEAPVARVVEDVSDVEVLVFDGIFVHRPELVDLWNLSVFLEVGFDVSVPRGARRGYGDADLASPANRRYVDGQRRYLATDRPRERATWVVDNTVLADAHVIAPSAS